MFIIELDQFYFHLARKFSFQMNLTIYEVYAWEQIGHILPQHHHKAPKSNMNQTEQQHNHMHDIFPTIENGKHVHFRNEHDVHSGAVYVAVYM